MLLYLLLSSSILPTVSNQNERPLTLPCGETRCPELDWYHQSRLGPGDLLLDGRGGPTLQEGTTPPGDVPDRRPPASVSHRFSMPRSRIAPPSIHFPVAVG